MCQYQRSRSKYYKMKIHWSLLQNVGNQARMLVTTGASTDPRQDTTSIATKCFSRSKKISKKWSERGYPWLEPKSSFFNTPMYWKWTVLNKAFFWRIWRPQKTSVRLSDLERLRHHLVGKRCVSVPKPMFKIVQIYQYVILTIKCTATGHLATKCWNGLNWMLHSQNNSP